MHKVQTTDWGMVGVRYGRDATGREWMVCPESKCEGIDRWNFTKHETPTYLVPGDLAVSGSWDRELRLALRADIADSRKEAEDSKFKYQATAKQAPEKRR